MSMKWKTQYNEIYLEKQNTQNSQRYLEEEEVGVLLLYLSSSQEVTVIKIA